jgi:hypothetical protein
LYLKSYVEQEGHARVHSNYEIEDGYKLGDWVSTQRKIKNQLSTEQVTRLESLEGWVWDALEFQWEQGFSYLKKFVEQEGHARVPRNHKTEEGYKLGQWVSGKRSQKEKLTPERITRLESLEGWVWDIAEFQREQGFSYLEVYVEQEGHARVPINYKTEDGYNLGTWVRTNRSNKYRLTPEQIKRLESLDGWVWDVLEFQWEEGFSYLGAYVKQEGHAGVPKSHKTKVGYKLGQWVHSQRQAKKKNKLTPKRITRLESFDGWDWDVGNKGNGSIN